MDTALYTESTGTFNRSAIMLRAWELFANSKRTAPIFKREASSFSKCLKLAWWEAKREKAQAPTNAWIKQNAIAAASLAAQVNALGCDTFKRAA